MEGKRKIMKKNLSEMTLEELWKLFPIILKEHNPDYKNWYLEEKESLMNGIGKETIKRINHIGSTAVEGLIAKPTIDILMEVDKICDISQLKEKLIRFNWTLMSFEKTPDFKMVFNKGYTPNGFLEKVYHLHVRYLGNWEELYFKDYLILHKDIAKEYGKLKTNLLKKYEHNRDAYTQAKTDFVKKYTALAKEELKNKYLS